MAVVKVQKNQHGNLRGFVGKDCVELFGYAFEGSAEFDAREWLEKMISEGHKLSPKSYLSPASNDQKE